MKEGSASVRMCILCAHTHGRAGLPDILRNLAVSMGSCFSVIIFACAAISKRWLGCERIVSSAQSLI